MRISQIIPELQKLMAREGDLVVTAYRVGREWEPVDHLFVHPAGRPYQDADGKRYEHSDRIVVFQLADD